MPCYSTVTQTKMTNHEHLGAALTALGYTVSAEPNRVAAHHPETRRGILFSRWATGAAFSTTEDDQDVLVPIQRKYAEVGIRSWAKQKGYQVAQNDGRKLTLVNRSK